MLVLKRLDDALKAGDRVRGIIRNVAIGQDGKTVGITLPSQDAQEKLIRSTYQAVGLDPLGTELVEAHGTGTVVGDHTEIQAIGNVFSNRTRSLYVGSVKGNIGHLENVSGIAGLIKAILALENASIPPSVNFKQPKSGLDLEKRGIKVTLTYSTLRMPNKLQVPICLESWPSSSTRRCSIK